MDLKQFEDKLNNKFKDYEPLVDGMKIWDNIEDQLPQPKEKKRFLWMWFLIPVLIFVLGYQLIDFTGTENAAIVNQTQVSSINQDTDTEKLSAVPAETKKFEIEQDLTVVNTPSQRSNINASKAQASANQVSKAQLNTTAANLSASPLANAGVDKKGTTVNTLPQPSNSNQAVTKTKNNLGGNLELAAGSVVAENVVSEKEFPAENKIFKKAENQAAKINEEIVLAEDTQVIETGKLSEPLVEEVNKSLPTASEPVDKEPVIEEQKTVETEKAQIAPKNAESRKFIASSSLATTVTVFGAMRSFINVTPEQQGLIDKKSDVEKSLETIQFGLDYERTFTERWSFTTGLRLWQYNRSSEHAVVNITQELMPTLTETNHLPDGSVQTIIEDVNTTVTENYDAVRFQKYRSLSVLALMNYKIYSGKKATIDLGAGAEFSLLGTQTGYELNTETTEYLMTEDADNRYKKRSGDYLVLRLRSLIDLNDQWTWSLGLESKYGLNGIQQDGLGYNQKFNFLGIQTGFNYTF